jgi:peptidoglycan/LPS O-acetylase OafA/YrhL
VTPDGEKHVLTGAAPSPSETGPRPDGNGFAINNFDLLRIFAATEVLIFHSIARLDIAIPFWLHPLSAFPGVPIFFVISGYLVSASFERRSSTVDYFRNRALRIYPGLWGCLVATVIVASAFGFGFFRPAAAAWFVAQMAGLIYTPQFLDQFGFGSYNGSLWTLTIELQFYLALPVLYWLVGRWRGNVGFVAAFAGLVLTALALAVLFPGIEADNETHLEKLLQYTFLPHIYLFALGLVMQRVRFYALPFVRGKGLIWLAAYLLIWALVPPSPVAAVATDLLLGLTAVSVAYTAPTLAQRVLQRQDISYGVYMYHGLVLNILVQLRWTGMPWLVVVVLVAAYAAGLASWMLVERRFLTRKHREPVTSIREAPTGAL